MSTPGQGGGQQVSDLPWLAAPLIDALRTQRGHALLVQGPPGAGQFEFAIALARAWLCETEAAQRTAGLACGRCESCHLATADQVHPDLCVLLPEAAHLTLGWRQQFDEAEPSEGKKKPSEWIAIRQVRAAIAFSALTRARSRLKVVVVHPAERMPAIAASALLKLLEEPQGAQRFVLACGDPASLLPTLRSRCHVIRLPAPDAGAAEQWLRAAGLADAALLLAASGGQPLAALQRQPLGLDAELWSRLPRAVAAGEAQALSRLPLPLVVESLQKLCHDAMLMACGAPPRYFPTASLPAAGDLHRLGAWATELQRAARHAEHPWNAPLKFEALVLQGQRALAADAPESASGRRDSVHSGA